MTFLRSRVARRIFGLFVACALVPILALAAISFYQVSTQLLESSRRHLLQNTKSQGMAIIQRLQMLDAKLQLAAIQARTHRLEDLPETLTHGFVAAPGRGQVFERSMTFDRLTAAEQQHLRAGRTILQLKRCSGGSTDCVVLARLMDSSRPEAGLLTAQARSTYLWDAVNLPAGLEECIFDSGNTPLVCPGTTSSMLGAPVRNLDQASGLLTLESRGQQYDAAYWTLPLEAQFHTGSWIVVLSQPHRDVLAPLALFRLNFLLVLLLAVWIVMLASVVQIRRTMIPLEKLKEGTQQIAIQDFTGRVDVHSGDEFEDLAGSFNRMARHLGRQFHALRTIHHIDEAILSSLNREGIVDAVLDHMPLLLPFDCFGITVLSADPATAAFTQLSIGNGSDEGKKRLLRSHASAHDLERLGGQREALMIGPGEAGLDFLAPLRKMGLTSFLVAPIFLDHRVFAALVCSRQDPLPADPEDVRQARQIADQLAVAFSNVELIEALERLSWGTLTALARAIDAKSPWTAGHSERVTATALNIARAMGLPAAELQTIHRGGLLHDIGKIGTPPAILNKPDKLDDQETQTMREHVRIGLRILEPIPGFQDAVAIVAQHHEWFDGSGYPEGLAGEQISLHARIFSVADCYDAMTSDRPYRKGLPKARALEIMKQSAGTQFDPKVVEVFLRLCAAEEPAPSSTLAAERFAGEAK